VIFAITLKGPLHKHASLVVNRGLTFGKKTNTWSESYEEIVAKDDLPNESMKTDKAMEFDSNKEISDNVGVDNEAQKSGRQKRKPAWLADYSLHPNFYQ
jgi:hypothetical protein